jgi:hypothetical protein
VAPAPAPTQSDKSGADQDEFYIPASTRVSPESGTIVSYVVNGQWLSEGWYSTDGAARVTVTTSPDSGTWVLDYSLETTAAEAPNGFQFDSGECMTSDRDSLRTATLSITNTPDQTLRYIRALEVKIFLADSGPQGRAGNELPVRGNPHVSRLSDGQTAVVELFDRDGDGSPDSNSGGSTTNEKRWRVVVLRSDLRDRTSDAGSQAYPVYDSIIEMPRCNMVGKLKRSCRESTVSLLARARYGGPLTWRYRITLFEKGREPRRSMVDVASESPRTIVLRRRGREAGTRLRVEFFDPTGTYVYSGGPESHWSRELDVRSAWKKC